MTVFGNPLGSELPSKRSLRQLWDEDFWREIFSQDIVDEWDRLIDAFNNGGVVE